MQHQLALSSRQGCSPRRSGGATLQLLATLLLLNSFCSAQQSRAASEAQTVPDLPVWSTNPAQPNRYIAAHGIRGFAGGYSEDGLEFWTFPLQLVDGYQVSFLLPEGRSVPAINMLTSVAVDPLGVTRSYSAVDFRVRERITTHPDHPGVVVLFSVEGISDLQIQVHLRPALNLMWPAGIGGQETLWD